MFCYQPNFFSQCEVMTSELFAQLIVSDAVVNRIRDYRAKLPELDRLREAAPDPIPADAPARPLVACKARTRSLSRRGEVSI